MFDLHDADQKAHQRRDTHGLRTYAIQVRRDLAPRSAQRIAKEGGRVDQHLAQESHDAHGMIEAAHHAPAQQAHQEQRVPRQDAFIERLRRVEIVEKHFHSRAEGELARAALGTQFAQ